MAGEPGKLAQAPGEQPVMQPPKAPGKQPGTQPPKAPGEKPGTQPPKALTEQPEVAGAKKGLDKMQKEIEQNPLFKKMRELLEQIGKDLAKLFGMDWNQLFTKNKFDMKKFQNEFKDKVNAFTQNDLDNMRIVEGEINKSGKPNGEWIYNVIGKPNVYQDILTKAAASNPQQPKTELPDDFGSKCLMMQFDMAGNCFKMPEKILSSLQKTPPLLNKNDLMFYKDGDKIYCGLIRGFNTSTKTVQLIINGQPKDIKLDNCIYGVYIKSNKTGLKDDAPTQAPAKTQPPPQSK
ncbi:hypothetical protein JW911_04105 [Candidatus Peregrinibacteria bacterium]|nr:hypothetical protein [Candidatus Peregrinibacteria bacterium]